MKYIQILFPIINWFHAYFHIEMKFCKQRTCGIKRFHDGCVTQSDRVSVMWSTFHVKFCKSVDEAISTLMKERDYWWCNFYDRPLFIQHEYVR